MRISVRRRRPQPNDALSLGVLLPGSTGVGLTTQLPALVVLPGLDGTGRLLVEFAAAARQSFESVVVVSYPPDAPLDYSALERMARQALPHATPFVLLAESFSGPIALSIAATPPANLVALVLSTTFARNPVRLLRPFAPWTRLAPVRAVPLALMSWWLLGHWATPTRQSALRAALHDVSPDVLRIRAAAALRIDVTPCLSRIHMPVLYVRATNDRLILAAAGEQILRALPQAELIELVGPHMLLQATPDAVARAVVAFASAVVST